MKNKHVLLTILLSFFSLAMMAQTFTLQGRVTDSNNNPVELATVAVAKQGRVTMTNLKGEYSIQLHSADSVVVRFSMVGYKTKTRVLRRPKGRQTLIVQLFDDNQIGEVTIVGQKRQTGTTEQLDVKNAQNTPSATGNAVEELIQQQAGVSTHSELSSQYNVRGGSFDENSVYINGV
ncbi:carboxypeptidase-like regulatory domain-containing protein, partial [Prevotella sp.]|uniref:carboxypeptidase-like regulatory domain-containing protein n=1 Tax=Prevotella sp. TaxID=59823 RepID=UPI003FD7F045